MEFPLFQDIKLRVLFCIYIYIYMHIDTVCTQHELCPMVVLRIPFLEKQLDLDSAIPRLEEGRYAAQCQVIWKDWISLG